MADTFFMWYNFCMQPNHIKSIGTIMVLGIITIIIAIGASVFQKRIVPTNNDYQSQDRETQLSSSPAQTNQNIIIDNLADGQNITLPMTVTGTVKNWFFEGSFPVFLKDDQGNELAIALASSPVDWMTADPIPFTVTLPVVNYTGPGTITFKKDNPSGEPQFDEEVVVNVVF